MQTHDARLPDDLDIAHRQIREQAETLRQQAQLIARLQHQLEQLLRQRYGKKSEKIDPDQLLLFAQEILAQTAPGSPAPQPPQSVSPDAGSKPKGHGRKVLPASLPRKPILYDVAPEELACPECGLKRQRIGEEVREQLEYVPASLLVLQHIRPKYACRACAAHVVIAERLPEPIEKGLPGTGLLAQVAVSKYADHLPLYRQEAIFRRHGVELSRSTMCDWMAVCAELLEPVLKEMKRRVLQSKVIQTDDTPVTVQVGGGGTKTGRFWVYCGDRDHPFIVYDYTPDHTSQWPELFLKDYRSGYLQSDAYSGYKPIHERGIVPVGCWAHARRKFYEARTTDAERAHTALAFIGGLYDVERQAKKEDLDDAARHKLRQEQSRPILNSFEAWLQSESTKLLPKSPICEATSYTRSHWAALARYLDVEYLAIDNNTSENALRPIAVGRRNWLFCGSDRGGRTAAVLMSLTASCKAQNIEPFVYLRDLLDQVSTHPHSRIAELLPDCWGKSQSQAGRKP